MPIETVYQGQIRLNGIKRDLTITRELNEKKESVFYANMGTEQVVVSFNSISQKWEANGQVTPFSQEAGKLIDAFFE